MSGADRIRRLEERVSAARRESLARGETFYPGPSRIHLAAFPPSERWDDWVELDSRAWPRRESSATTCWCRRPASTASPPAACSPTSTATRCRSASSRATPSTPARAAATAPRARRRSTRSTTPTASSTRCSAPARAARAVGAGQLGRGARRHRRAHPHARSSRTATTRSCTTSGGPARTASPSGCSPRGASTATTRTPTSAPAAGAPATTSGWGSTGRAPTTPTPRSICLISPRTWRPATTSTRTPSASWRRSERGAKLIVFDTRLSNTATHADSLAGAVPGSEAAILLAIASHILATGRYDREFVRRWWNWEEYLDARAPGRAADVRALRGHPRRALRRLHLRVRRARVGRGGRDAARGRRARGRRRHRASRRTPGARPRPATSAAGRCRAACSCSTRCSARSAPRAARSRTPGTSSSRARSTCRRIPSAGTSSPGRWSTRSR